MVSQSDPYPSSSLAIRGVPSLAGGVPPTPASAAGAPGGGGSGAGVSSRSRRYNRSHAGGTCYAPLNEFPVFSHSGDVEIVVRVRSGHENRYLLHRDTLARCSGFFEASTSKEWSRAQLIAAGDHDPDPDPDHDHGHDHTDTRGRSLASGAELARRPETSRSADSKMGGKKDLRSSSDRPETRRRWRYELDLGQDDNDKPILVQKDEEAPSAATTAAATLAAAAAAPLPPSPSIFGGGGSGNSMANASTAALHSPSLRGSAKVPPPTHTNPGFFRSMANLALPSPHHSSRRHGSGSGSIGGRHHYNTSHANLLSLAPLLPPPSPEDADLLRDYDNLFRIMYNYAPILDGVNIADAYVQCKSLLAVADEYDALAVVGPRVDHHLLQFQSRLWRQIAKYPISYLRLGYLARSRVIFQEALVHVVGQWPAGERSLRAALPDAVLDLIEDKVDELAEAVSRVEARLFRLHLTTRSGERVSPFTAYLDWLAVSLFRQWLADNTTPNADSAPRPVPPNIVVPERRGAGATTDRYGHRHGNGHYRSRMHGRGSSSSDSSDSARGGQETALTLHVRTTTVPPLTPPLSSLGRTYRTLGTAAGPSFLGHDECKRFLKLSAELYSRDNLRRFEKRIDELKAMAREIVRPLMGSGLELDIGRGGNGPNECVTYFTCTFLSDRDLPWMLEM